ncbi:MAG: hypothetical protein AAF416_11345 [Pseudomonadota bacterium]
MFRILAGVFLLLTLGALIRDLIASLDAGAWTPVALGQWWFEIDRNSLQQLQPAIERHVSPDAWVTVQSILEAPAIYTVGAPLILFWVLSLAEKRRKPKATLTHRARF